MSIYTPIRHPLPHHPIPPRCPCVPQREAARDGDAAGVAAALDAGDDVNAGDGYCGTALHKVAGRGHAHLVELLVLRGANPDAEDEDGEQGRTAALMHHWWLSALLVMVILMTELSKMIKSTTSYAI